MFCACFVPHLVALVCAAGRVLAVHAPAMSIAGVTRAMGGVEAWWGLASVLTVPCWLRVKSTAAHVKQPAYMRKERVLCCKRVDGTA
jgi:hypothetical protein